MLAFCWCSDKYFIPKNLIKCLIKNPKNKDEEWLTIVCKEVVYTYYSENLNI